MTGLLELQQGDISYNEKWFVFRSTPDDAGNSLVEEKIEGIVILSQTCDIIRSPQDRPYLEVSPLVRIDEPQVLREIRNGSRPRYAYIPTAAANMLVADLDRVMTVDKAAASEWSFQRGCTDVLELTIFAQAIARKRNRFAFPDELVGVLRPLQQRIIKKHAKNSPEGELLRILKEIRIKAFPALGEDKVSLYFYFMVAEETLITPALEEQTNTWIDLLTATATYISFDAMITSYNSISALEYRNSIPLDLDYLS